MQARTFIVDPELERLFHGSFEAEFRRSVRAFAKHRRMSPSRLGLLALGDPSFIARHFPKGQKVKLDTADTVRRFMQAPMFRPLLEREIGAFIEITGLKPWQVGEWALGESRFIRRISAGASPYLSTVDVLRGWMHRQLRPGQLDEVLLAVAGIAADGTARRGAGNVFFIGLAIRMDRRNVDEGKTETVDDAPSRRAAGLEPTHAGTLPRHRRRPAVPQDRALGALHARGPGAVARRLREDLHVRRRARRGRGAAMRAATGANARFRGTGAVCAAVAVRLAITAGPAAVSLLTGMEASATTDTTFAAPLTTVTNMVGGTGGQLAAVLAVGAALVGSVLRFNATQIMGAVGVGVAAGAGAGVVTNIVGTAIV